VKHCGAEQATDYSIKQPMRFACCLTKADYAIIYFSTAAMVTQTRFNVTLVRTLAFFSLFSVPLRFAYLIQFIFSMVSAPGR
jgi:hypothetical protein